EPRGVGCNDHGRDEVRHRLWARVWFSGRVWRRRVRDRGIDARLRDADRPCRDRVPSRVESGHGDLEAVADFAEPVLVGDAQVLEDELARVGRTKPEFSVQRLASVVLRRALEHERRYPLVAFCRIGLREDEREIGYRAVADPHLPSAQHPAIALTPSTRPKLRRVAADLRLGETEAADQLALAESREPALFLLLGPELEDRELDERDLDRRRRAHRRVGASDLLGDERVRDVVEPNAAVLLRDGPAEKPKRRHLREDVLREGLVAVAFARARRDFFVGEVFRELADRELLWSEVEVHRGESIDSKRNSPRERPAG